MSHSVLRSLGFLALSLAAVTVAHPARASDLNSNAVANEVTVRFGDLNLQSPLAADLLVTRIEQAAEQVCGVKPSLYTGYYVMRQRYAACLAQAARSAVAKVNQAAVTAAYERTLNPTTERLATR